MFATASIKTLALKMVVLPVTAGLALAAATPAAAVALGAPAPFYPTYTITSLYNIGPYLLFERGTPPGGSQDIGPHVTRADNNGNFYTTPGTSTIVNSIDPGLNNYRSLFLSVSDLALPSASNRVSAPNHLILGVTNLYSGTLIGQEFTDIFPGFDEGSLINAVLTVADLNLGNAQPGEENEPEFNEAFSLLYSFEEALRGSSTSDPYFRVNETLNVVAFSEGQSVGSGVFSATPIGPSAVPEPASWAMMIGGFGLAGAAMRRRQQRATASFA